MLIACFAAWAAGCGSVIVAMVDKDTNLAALPKVAAGFEISLSAQKDGLPGAGGPSGAARPRMSSDAARLENLGARPAVGSMWPKGDGFQVTQEPDRLIIAHSSRPVAEFVFRDGKILRPYFANVHTPGGLKATRNHPPIAGADAADHDTMHPGLWLAFGDINGADFWRNKGRIEHIRFTAPPVVKDGLLTYTTECVLRAPDGRAICSLTNRFTLRAQTHAWLIGWDATFRASDADLTFGDQEEMGFGARVATGITEKNGGVITNRRGLRTANATWGQPSEWCDYSGLIDGRRIGITLFADPGNFRPSWWHNRDYGVFVANPFGRASMKQGEKSLVTVRRGEILRLRFGAAFHSDAEFSPGDFYLK